MWDFRRSSESRMHSKSSVEECVKGFQVGSTGPGQQKLLGKVFWRQDERGDPALHVSDYIDYLSVRFSHSNMYNGFKLCYLQRNIEVEEKQDRKNETITSSLGARARESRKCRACRSFAQRRGFAVATAAEDITTSHAADRSGHACAGRP